jgi:hypothetical protein
MLIIPFRRDTIRHSLGRRGIVWHRRHQSGLVSRRWTPLSRLAMLSLAYQTTLLIDVALWLVTGRLPKNDARPAEAEARELESLRRSIGLPDPTSHDLGAVQFEEYAPQLEHLLTEPRWRTFAVHQMDVAKFRNRQGIGIWAAAMLTTSETADVLTRLADLNEGGLRTPAIARNRSAAAWPCGAAAARLAPLARRGGQRSGGPDCRWEDSATRRMEAISRGIAPGGSQGSGGSSKGRPRFRTQEYFCAVHEAMTGLLKERA